MKIPYYILIVLLACGALFVSCDSKKGAHNQLIVGTTPTYFPYEFKNTTGSVDGFDIDLAKALSKELNRDLVLKEMDFDALILSLKQGKIDAIISGMSITKERQKEITMISYQQNETKELLLAFWENIPSGITSLEGLAQNPETTIAVQMGTYQADCLSVLHSGVSKLLESNTDLIMDIQYKKVPAALFEPLVGRALQIKFPKLRLLPIPLPRELWAPGNGIGIHKENSPLSSEVARALSELKKKGVVASLEKKWFGGEV